MGLNNETAFSLKFLYLMCLISIVDLSKMSITIIEKINYLK